jgi:uncharacterized membrane protein YsdA (DUF1294 family)
MATATSSLNGFRFLLRAGAALTLMALVLSAVALDRAPRWLGLWYVALGIASAVAYGWDKRMAKNNGWRVPESTLLFIDLAGGIIGGLLAQVGFHHKTSKPGFATATWIAVVVHAGIAGALLFGLLELPAT